MSMNEYEVGGVRKQDSRGQVDGAMDIIIFASILSVSYLIYSFLCSFFPSFLPPFLIFGAFVALILLIRKEVVGSNQKPEGDVGATSSAAGVSRRMNQESRMNVYMLGGVKPQAAD